MPKLAKYVTGIVSKPVSTFHIILTDKPFALAFLLVLAYGVSISATVYFSLPKPPNMDKIIALLSPAFTLSLWFTLSLLLYLAGRRLGGKAMFKDIILITGMAHTILIAFGLISCTLFILRRFLHLELLSHIIKHIPIGYIAILWFMVVVVVGIREAQGFSTGRAIGSVIIALLYALAVGIILILLL